jgi:tRNA U38,U39,U40 pseudouridine synthase TruA
VYRWEVTRQEDTVVIECEANGFLKQQIRKANGVLTEIGKKRQPIDLVDRVLESNSAVRESIPLLPAYGLCLIEVKYPEPALPVEPENTGKVNEKS